MNKFIIVSIWLLLLLPVAFILSSLCFTIVLISNWSGAPIGLIYQSKSDTFPITEIQALSCQPDKIPYLNKNQSESDAYYLYLPSSNCYEIPQIIRSIGTINFDKILTTAWNSKYLNKVSFMEIITLNHNFKNDILSKLDSRYSLNYLSFFKLLFDTFIWKNPVRTILILYVILIPLTYRFMLKVTKFHFK